MAAVVDTLPAARDVGARHIDPPVHTALARLEGSLSTAAAALAYTDWALHLVSSPGKQGDLVRLALQMQHQLLSYVAACALHGGDGNHETMRCIEPARHDHRFDAPAWRRFPFNVLQQSFLLAQAWWAEATRDVWAVEPHHAQQVAFWARQWLDVVSPGNFWATNPVVLERTLREGGLNFWRGAVHAADDMRRLATNAPPAGSERYAVGRDLARTPGRVVLRNRLVELIQYTPATAAVHPEPVLIVPAWIMKFYILDLAPQSSLVEYLVAHGHTVFCISWKNPLADDRDIGFDDYRQLGPVAALEAIGGIVPGQRVHLAGYCLGGTLAAITAAAMARDGDTRLASLTLFAAQTDFSEPGELSLFIDESQVGLLEAQMAETGYLTSRQMAGTFQMLRSYDLLWSRMVNEYLLGVRSPLTPLMAWNADATRMPARMHAEYLRSLYLRNELATGGYEVDGRAVLLHELTLPLFVVGTVTDHVSPWRSVYKLHRLSPAELTFVLTTGGHNAGIVSPPGTKHRHRILTRPAGARPLAEDDWYAAAPERPGSWWPEWQSWLRERSGAPRKPPRLGASLGAAPGQYVLQK